MNKVVDIEQLIEGGRWASEDEYVIPCPYCEESAGSHSHCYVNVKKRLFSCKKCSEEGLLSALLKFMGLDEAANAIKYHRAPQTATVEAIAPVLIDCSLFPKIGTVGSVMDGLATQYLLRRGFTTEEIELYDVRFAEKARYYGRVIFPIYEGSEIVCISARSFMPNLEPRYLYPHKGETVHVAADVIFCTDTLLGEEYKDDIVLVEGIIDAISLRRKTCKGLWPMALLSKAMSERQFNKLSNLGKDRTIWMMLDKDAARENELIAARLRRSGWTVMMCALDAKDPDEATQDQVDKAFLTAKPYDEDYDLDRKITRV